MLYADIIAVLVVIQLYQCTMGRQRSVDAIAQFGPNNALGLVVAACALLLLALKFLYTGGCVLWQACLLVLVIMVPFLWLRQGALLQIDDFRQEIYGDLQNEWEHSAVHGTCASGELRDYLEAHGQYVFPAIKK